MNTFTVTIHRKDQALSREVNKDSFTVGRSVDCDIALNDNHISRVHLVVSRRWNQIWIEDKNSSNGTFVNGTKIVQGTPVNVIPTDRVQLGKSEYVLVFSLETDEVEEPVVIDEPPVQAPTPGPAHVTAAVVSDEVSQPTASATPEPGLEDTVAMPPPSMAPFQAEKILHDAKRKAAQIILEGETQAEKRVQAIYQKAREAQAQAEYFYQTRLAEAHKEADAILADYQKQGQTLLHEARSMAQELREEVDVYVQSLKQKAKTDTEDIIAEATLTAEKMKTEALEQGRAAAKTEADSMLHGAREEASRMLEFARLQTQEIQEKFKGEKEALDKVSAELKDLQEQQAAAAKNLEDTKATAAKTLEEMNATAATVSAQIQAAETKLKDLLTAEEQKTREYQTQQKTLTQQNKTLEDSLRQLQEKQAQLAMDVRDIEAKKSHLFKEYEAQKIFLNEKLEKEKSQIAKSEEERLEEMRLEMSKRLQKMERDLLDDVLRRKELMVKEIHAAVEKEVVRVMEPTQWRDLSGAVEKHIHEAIEGRVASLSQSTATTQKPVDLIKKRKSEKLRWATMGLAMGALAYFVSQVVVEQVAKDQNPMQTRVQAEAKKRQEDLEKRRFNPAQAEDLKDSYTDAVIYTRNFPEIYTDSLFQQRLYKSASQYLLKTWRVDEDKSIQVLSMATALVKELTERKAKIHPDFIKEGIEKMRATETETLARMKDILGSEVRVESFRRFERNFYREEVQRRRMAQH